MSRTLYLGLEPGAVAERCVLVGDPRRIDAFAAAMPGAELVTEERGLRTLTGRHLGTPMTVAAFGMGAPIAVIVMEELAALGARVFLRAGTAMRVGQTQALGTFVVARAAVRDEAVSSAYAPPSYPATADPGLTRAVCSVLHQLRQECVTGLMASSDAFYRELFAARAEMAPRVRANLNRLSGLGVCAADMETSALFTVASVLGVRAGSACLLTVDGSTGRRLAQDQLLDGQRLLVEAALETLVNVEEIP